VDAAGATPLSFIVGPISTLQWISMNSTIRLWNPGDHAVLRGVIENRIWLAQSVVVVQDLPHESILALLPGAECVFPEGYFHRKWKDNSGIRRWQEAKKESWTFRKFAWQRNRFLIFLKPMNYFDTILYWDHTSGAFQGYYINFQLPVQRSQIGFDTLDLDLDVVVDPEFNWYWKDEDAFQEAIDDGGIKSEWVAEIEAAKVKVLNLIERRDYPLGSKWTEWRPDPTWELAKLPENWSEY
jgi:hypothetical protein